jgi:hypothetical protein
MLGGWLQGYTQFLFEAATAGMYAAETAFDTLRQPSVTPLTRSMMGPAPEALGTTVEVGGKPMLLPVRIADASQAWSLYYVPVQFIRKQFGDDNKVFSAFSFGDGRVPVAVICTDFRAGDLGIYQEISLVTFVTPRSDPAAPPGMFFLSLVVNGKFSHDAALELWNFKKIFAPGLRISYNDEQVTFAGAPAMGPGDDNFRISFPRLAGFRSTAVPVYLYSTGQREESSIACRTVLTRNGTGEGIQIGGDVEMEFPNLGDGCLCVEQRAAMSNCFCRRVLELELKDAHVVANGWTEHMSGGFGPALPCKPVD